MLWTTPLDPSVSPRDGYGGFLFGFNHFHTKALYPGGTCVVFVSSGRWHPNCYIAANFWLHCSAYKCSFWHRCHREDTSSRRAKWEFLTFQYHLQIALSSHKNGKEKNNTFFFFLVVLLYDSLSIGWLFSAWTALAQLRFPSTAGPFPETEPYLPVSDELPVIKLAARNKTTRLRGSGGGSGGLKPFNVGRETAESRAELPESKTRG